MRRRRARSSRQFSVFIEWRYKRVYLNCIYSSNSLFITLSCLSFCCKFNHFWRSISKFLYISSVWCLSFLTQYLINFISCTFYWFLRLLLSWFRQLWRIQISIFEVMSNICKSFFLINVSNHVLLYFQVINYTNKSNIF